MTIDDAVKKYSFYLLAVKRAQTRDNDHRYQLSHDIENWLDKEFSKYLYENANNLTAMEFHTSIASSLFDFAIDLRRLII